MGSLLADLRFGGRMLRRNKGFAAVAILTLALGIGVNTAMFSVLNAVVLRSLPYADPDRLFVVESYREGRALSVSLPDVEDWSRDLAGQADLAASSYWTFNLTGREVPERILGARVSGNFFDVLGASALLGRAVRPEDDRAEATPVAVLGYALWQRTFGGDPAVLGRAITLNGIVHTVVGVMPPRFGYPSREQELWAPLANELTGTPRDARFLDCIARLRGSVGVESARSELDVSAARIAAAFPDTNKGFGTRLSPAKDVLVADVRPALLVLSGAVGFVLLIACANVSNLLLARAAARGREVAIRTALGASRLRLARQFVAENLVLAAAGGFLGLVVGRAGLAVVRRLSTSDIPRLDEAGLDGTVLGFTLGVSLLTGLVLGVVPVLRAGSRAPRTTLQESERTTGGARSRLRTALVVTQMALALTLLVGGGLLVRSLHNLLSVPTGFEPHRLLTLNVFLGPPRYRELAPQYAFVRESLAALETLPGVVSAATVSQLPLAEGSVRLKMAVEGRPFDRAEAPVATFRAVSPSYFRTMGIPLREGRAPAESDSETAPVVVVVNQALARSLWPGESALGRRVRFLNDPDVAGRPRWHTIVGVVGDVKSRGLHADEEPVAYVPFAQRIVPFVRFLSLVVRTAGDPMPLVPSVRRSLLSLDPDLPAFLPRSFDEIVDRSVADRRFQAVLLQSFAGLALVLAAIGVYGVLSEAVNRRTREIGVRMALGAEPRQVMRLVLREGMALALGGLALGLPAALALSRTLRSFLFGVGPGDPVTLAAVALVLAGAALVAAYLPARRATRVDPMAALRAE